MAALDARFRRGLAFDGFVDGGEGFGGIVLEFEGIFPTVAVFADVFGKLEDIGLVWGFAFSGQLHVLWR